MGDVPMEHCASMGALAWATDKPLTPSWAPDPAPPAAAGAAAAGEGGPAEGVGAEGGGATGGGVALWEVSVQLPSSRRAAAGPWWPVEVVDPFRPPLGFTFTVTHMSALPEGERRRFVPTGVAAGVAKQAVWSSAGAGAARRTLPSHFPASGRAGGVPGSGGSGVYVIVVVCLQHVSSTPSHPQVTRPLPPTPPTPPSHISILPPIPPPDVAAFDAPPPGPRKMLVLFLGLGKFEWRFDWELLPFEQFQTEFEGQGGGLGGGGSWGRGTGACVVSNNPRAHGQRPTPW